MRWYDIPIDKPREISELEEMGQEELSSMPPREMDEKLVEAAEAVAKGYKRERQDADYEGCVSIVSAALSVTGNSLGGEFGALLVGRSNIEANHACRRIFPKE